MTGDGQRQSVLPRVRGLSRFGACVGWHVCVVVRKEVNIYLFIFSLWDFTYVRLYIHISHAYPLRWAVS